MNDDKTVSKWRAAGQRPPSRQIEREVTVVAGLSGWSLTAWLSSAIEHSSLSINVARPGVPATTVSSIRDTRGTERDQWGRRRELGAATWCSSCAIWKRGELSAVSFRPRGRG